MYLQQVERPVSWTLGTLDCLTGYHGDDDKWFDGEGNIKQTKAADRPGSVPKSRQTFPSFS